jgi:hypothetical protein
MYGTVLSKGGRKKKTREEREIRKKKGKKEIAGRTSPVRSVLDIPSPANKRGSKGGAW